MMIFKIWEFSHSFYQLGMYFYKESTRNKHLYYFWLFSREIINKNFVFIPLSICHYSQSRESMRITILSFHSYSYIDLLLHQPTFKGSIEVFGNFIRRKMAGGRPGAISSTWAKTHWRINTNYLMDCLLHEHIETRASN